MMGKLVLNEVEGKEFFLQFKWFIFLFYPQYSNILPLYSGMSEAN
ncbi:MAG: hypothetical protein SRB2_01466 [Desulfobacteraceae bacterium Eth-SRB2]|nr:MAG: hypothetical protein SRB2_01466 [Desulfobacteraceae bacterium Eth-SRB2]